MGGGGGRTFTSDRGPEELVRAIRKAENETAIAEFDVELAGTLSDLLRALNSRDTQKVQSRLEDITRALEGEVDGKIDQLYGGSVAKHTYVDGLSDIDSLMLLNNLDLANKRPSDALLLMARILSERPPEGARVSVGRMAVTVDYPDGMSIQLLPSLRTTDGLKIPSSRRDAWSDINPDTFREALTRRNGECAGKLIPTIKLAKAVIGTLPEGQRLSGYHVESLAIAAFRDYQGVRAPSAMLPYLFEQAKDLVQAPIRDKTGQSLHVDDYLGAAGSNERMVASHVLERIAKRMRNASAARSSELWRSVLGLEE